MRDKELETLIAERDDLALRLVRAEALRDDLVAALRLIDRDDVSTRVWVAISDALAKVEVA